MKTYPSPSFSPAVPLYDNFSVPAPRLTPWADIHALIADPASPLAARTATIRESLADKQRYDRLKRALPAITPAALFSGKRDAAHLSALSGCSLVDCDHVPSSLLPTALEALRRDPHTMLLYVTPSGQGLRIIFRFESDAPEVCYLDAWQQGNEYFSALAHLPFDRATKDPTRLSFLCHDAQAYFNPQALPLRVIPLHRQPTTLSPSIDALSAQCDDPIALAERLVRHGGMEFVVGQRHSFLVRLCFLMLRMGVGEGEALAHLQRHYASHDEPLAPLLASVYRHSELASSWVWNRASRAQQPTLRKRLASDEAKVQAEAKAQAKAEAKEGAMESLMAWLDLEHRFRYNVLSGQYEQAPQPPKGGAGSPLQGGGGGLAWTPVDDRTVNGLWLDYTESSRRELRNDTLWQAIRSSRTPLFNPIDAYFDALPAWDGKDHIAQLAGRVKLTEAAFFELCFRKWFVAMVASMMRPEVVNQAALILLGPQGIYKSTFFRLLLPPELRHLYLEKSNATRMSKDDKLALSEFALIGLEEFDAMTDRELSQIKALMTASVISERAAYDRLKTSRPHLASFCGTGNNLELLTDPTGNRRWLTFEVERIEDPYAHPLPYPQLYAQAKALVDSGYDYWLSPDEQRQLARHQVRFLRHSAEYEALMEHYALPGQGEGEAVWKSFTTIAFLLKQQDRVDCRDRSLQQALQQAGFEKRRRHGVSEYYVVPKSCDP